MDSSDYNLIRVETPGNLFGLEPTQPGQERKPGKKNSEQRARRSLDQTDEPDDAQEGSADPTADQEDPHTVDYKA
jgi:hypothetical protein